MCTLSFLHPMWDELCCHPFCFNRTQSWPGAPSSGIETWPGAFHVTGRDRRNCNSKGDGQQWAKPPPRLLLTPLRLSHKSNQSLPRLVLPSLSGLRCASQFATTVPSTQLGIFQVKMALLICQTRQYFSLWHMHWKRFRAGAVALPMAVQCWTLVSSPPTIYSWDSICLFCILNIWQHFRHLWPPSEESSVYSDLRKTQGVSGDLQRHKNLFNENLGACFRQTSSPRIYNMRSR